MNENKNDNEVIISLFHEINSQIQDFIFAEALRFK